MKRRGVLALGVAAAGSAAVGSAGLWVTARASGPHVLNDANIDWIMGAESPFQWVDNFDFVVDVRVDGPERRIEVAEEERGHRQEVRRTVRLRLGAVVWSSGRERRRPPAVLERYDVLGWGTPPSESVLPDRLRELAYPDACRLEPGHRYLMALYRNSEGAWHHMPNGGALPFDGAVAGHGEWEGSLREAPRVADGRPPRLLRDPDGGKIPPTMEQLTRGRSSDYVAAVLDSVPKDPMVTRFAHLPTEERVRRVSQERYG